MTEQAGTVTILFTDLVGSTALSDRLGEDLAQALRRAHERILKQQFERFAGRIVKGTGDGFMVAFSTARQGVECAVAIQQAMKAQHVEGRYLELGVRIGLHTGEPVAENDDLYGRPVNLAARVAAEAGAGQVFVSEVTQLLASQSTGLEFVALGERVLKGFTGGIPLFEIHWAEMPSTRPRLTPFVGRQNEQGLLRQRLDTAKRGQGALVLVAGEAGIGKTRLVSELLIEGMDRGFRVLIGRAFETRASAPYMPVAEALGQLLRGRNAEELLAHLNGNAPYLARLLPQLYHLLPDIGEPRPLTPEGERYRLFEAVSDFFLSIAQTQPLLLFFDDLHWADDASLLLLQHFARRLEDAPVLVIGAYRHLEIEGEHPLAVILAELAREHLDPRIVLSPFRRDEAAIFVKAMLREVPARHVVEALYATAEGNPFFTEELVRHLEDQARDLSDSAATVGDWAIPEGVRQVIGRRLARLEEGATKVLAYSSTLGRKLYPPEVATVTGMPEAYVLDLLDEALAARLLVEEDECYVFAHPLIQETLYQGLTVARRRQLHRRVAEGLEQLYEMDLDRHLGELAHHFIMAGRRGRNLEKAIDYAMRAAEQALSLAAFEEASRLYGLALEAFEATGAQDDRRRCEILLELGDAQWKAGETPAARETFLTAAALARELDIAENLARAALGMSGTGIVQRIGLVDDRLVELLEEALEKLGQQPSALRAMLLSRLAMALYWTDAQEQRASLSKDAVEIARGLGDQAALSYSLSARYYALLGPSDVQERVIIGTELLALGNEAGDHDMILLGHWALLYVLLEQGDMSGVRSALQEYVALSRDLRQPQYSWYATMHLALDALLQGRLEESEKLTHEALAIGQRIQHPDAVQLFGLQAFVLRTLQGRLEELEAPLKVFADQYRTIPAWRCALAFLYAETDRRTEALTEFEQLAVKGFVDLPHDVNWLPYLALLSRVCSYLNDVSRASMLYDLLLPHARRNVILGPGITCVGSTSSILGLLATTSQRWDEAEAHIQDALKIYAAMEAPPFLSDAQYQYARMLLVRDHTGDKEQANVLLTETLAEAEQMGMAKVAFHCRELLDKLNSKTRR